MAVLACDLCGGKIVMKSGGIGVCNDCGMEYSSERLREKISENGGAVEGQAVVIPKTDNSQVIENYLELANNALSARNYGEAESYANRIIELDATNCKAWAVKGEAAGWQSTVANPRFSESVSAFVKAVKNVPENEKASVTGLSEWRKLFEITRAIMNLCAEHFSEYPCEENAERFLSIADMLLENIRRFGEEANFDVDGHIEVVLVGNLRFAKTAVLGAYNDIIFPEYGGGVNDPDRRPNKYEWDKYLNRIDYCILLLEKSLDRVRTLWCHSTYAAYDCCKLLVTLQQRAIDSCSWKREFDSYRGWYWIKEWSLSASAKQIRQKSIAEYCREMDRIERAIKEIKRAEAEEERKAKEEEERKAREEAEARLNEYWAEHANEKKALEDEMESLKNQVNDMRGELKNIPEKKQKAELIERKMRLRIKLESLGIFKGKEKKAVQEEMAEISSEIDALTPKISETEKTLREKIDILNKRIKEIKNELTKAR